MQHNEKRNEKKSVKEAMRAHMIHSAFTHRNSSLVFSYCKVKTSKKKLEIQLTKSVFDFSFSSTSWSYLVDDLCCFCGRVCVCVVLVVFVYVFRKHYLRKFFSRMLEIFEFSVKSFAFSLYFVGVSVRISVHLHFHKTERISLSSSLIS